MANNNLTEDSFARSEPLRIYSADDVYYTPTGNIRSVGNAPSEGAALPLIETVRFSPLVLRRQDILADDAVERLLDNIHKARADEEDWLHFVNTELAKQPGNRASVTPEGFAAVLDRLEREPQRFVDECRTVLNRNPGKAPPVDEQTLINFEHTLRDPDLPLPKPILSAFGHARIPLVLKQDSNPLPLSSAYQTALADFGDPRKGALIFRAHLSNDKNGVATGLMAATYPFFRDEPEVAEAIARHRPMVNAEIKKYVKTSSEPATEKSRVLRHPVESVLYSAYAEIDNPNAVDKHYELTPASKQLYTDFISAITAMETRSLAKDMARRNPEKIQIMNIGRKDQQSAHPKSDSLPVPFYLLPKDAPPPTEAGGPVAIGGRCDFLITPACVHEAERTGKFHYMRVSKAALNAEPDSAKSLAHILVSVDGLHVKDKKAFQEAINYGREVLKRNGYALKTQDGRLLDIDRYFQQIEQHADEWLKAAQQQITDHNRTLQTKLGYVKAEHEKVEANASPVVINKLYQNMDGAAQSIIRQSGINYFIDNEETSGLPQLYEKQNAILVPRSYLMEPQATFMLRHTAVARNIDMKQYPDMEQLRLLAMEEIKAKVEKSSKELGRTGRVNALAEVMSAMRGEDADKFRKSLPATYLAYHQEEMLLAKKAAELDGRPATPLPKATDTAFVLNRDVLTKPQQAYFEQLNHIIGMLGVSPDEFDKHFRAQMLQQVALIKLKAKETGMNAAVKEKHGPVPNSVQALYAELHDARSLIGTPEVIAQGDKSAPVRKTTKLKTKKDGFEGLFSKLLDYHFGTGNAGMPEKPLHHEAVLIKTIEQSAARENSPLSQNENVLQLYASGQRLMPLLKELKSVAEDVSSKIFYPPNLQSYFEASMHNTVAVLADEGAKRQVGGDGTAVRRELQQLEILSKQAFLWPEELAKAREVEAKAREIESQRTLRHLEQVRQDEDKKRKEARIPAAVAVSGIVVDRIFRESGKAHGRNTAERNDDIARMGTLKSRLQELAAMDAMNAKFPPHAELAGALFNDEVMRALEYTHLLPVNGKGKKLPVVSPAARERFSNALKQVFSIDRDDEDASTPDVNRNELLKKRLADFPELIIAGLGDEKALKELRDTVLARSSKLPAYKGLEDTKRAALSSALHEKARTLLAAEGIVLPAPEAPTQPAQPEANIPVAAATAIENKPIPEPVLTPPSAQTEEGVQTPAVFTSIIAAENGHSSKPQQRALLQSQPVKPALTEDEILERMVKRDDAFKDSKTRLLADAKLFLEQAQSKGFNQFDCNVDLYKPGLPIILKFSKEEKNEDGEVKIRRQQFKLDQHAKVYASHDLPVTLNDAVDLKIAVQSEIRNTPGIEMARDSRGNSGQRAVELDTQMPLPVTDYKITERSGGMYSLVFTARDPYSREVVHPSIPLGVAAINKDEAEKRELEERAQHVIDYLHDIGNQRTASGLHVYATKRDVMMKLESWLKDEGKEWVTKESIVLPGFSGDTLLHVASEGKQKITLAPLSMRMDAGGDNPSWHLHMPFYIGDKNVPAKGELVRTRVLNLQTRNKELAVARALESLLGVKTKAGTTVVEGFLPHLQQHMQATQDEWHVENKDTPQEKVIIGKQPLQDFLDDMMRYERDIGAHMTHQSEPDADGNVRITLQAVRGLTGDYGKTATFAPEHMYESDGDIRKPIAYTITVPADKTNKINDFIKAVNDHMGWHADEVYSSVALGEPGQQDTRKEPLIYRTAQVRQSLIDEMGAQSQKIFGQRLRRNWHETAGTGAVNPANKEEKHRHRHHNIPNIDGEDRAARYARRSSNEPRTLG